MRHDPSLPPVRLFVSYAREDDELRERLGKQLEFLKNRHLIETWHDRRIGPGAEWEREIARELEDADIILLLVSDAFLNSPYIRAVELRRALKRGKAGTALVIPIILRTCGWRCSVISDLQVLPRDGEPVTSARWGSCDEALADVADELANAIEDWRGPPIPEEWDDRPYPGPLTFGFKGAPFFFGRRGETDELVARLADPDCRFLAVIGASGTGRSSLINAGLRPRLAEGAIDGSEEWRVRCFKPASPTTSPEDDPFVALAAHVFLAPGGEGREEGPLLANYRGSANDLADELAKSPARITNLVDDALARKPDAAKIIFFIDQFEELFTKSKEEHREKFINLLAEAVQHPGVRILITLRDDFQADALRYSRLAALLQGQTATFLLGLPGHDALKEIICRPARLKRVGVDDDLAETIINDAGRGPGVLPLIAFCLSKLWRTVVGKRPAMPPRITLRAYEIIGGLRGAIGKHIDELLADLDRSNRSNANYQSLLKSIFPALVTMENEKPIRRRADRSSQLSRVEELIDELVKSHILCAQLTTDERTREKRRTVELAHDALLDVWPALKDWVEANRTDFRLWDDLLRIARKWQQTSVGKKSFLWHGWRLKQAKDLLRRKPFPKPADETADIERFVRAASTRKWINVASVGVAGAVIAAFFLILINLHRGAMPVDSFAENPFGLYNVLGNVWEWTDTCQRTNDVSQSGRCERYIAKGGSWDNHEEWKVRVDYNNMTLMRSERVPTVGFRVAMRLEPGYTFVPHKCPEGITCPEMKEIKSGRVLKRPEVNKGTPCRHDPKTKSEYEPVHVERFAIGRYEVRIAEWESYLKDEGRSTDLSLLETESDKDKPITLISWEDADNYVKWLSKKTQEDYKLPTIYEWELAARGGVDDICRYWGEEIGNDNANCVDCGITMRQFVYWAMPISPSKYLLKYLP